MPFVVVKTDEFAEIFSSLDEDIKVWIRKITCHLEINPGVGKPLGFRWFREKKFNDKRLYYLVYNEINKVLLVGFSGKKDQEKIISHILQNLERYNRIAGKS